VNENNIYYPASTPLWQSDDANSWNQHPAVKGVGDDFLRKNTIYRLILCRYGYKVLWQVPPRYKVFTYRKIMSSGRCTLGNSIKLAQILVR